MVSGSPSVLARLLQGLRRSLGSAPAPTAPAPAKSPSPPSRNLSPAPVNRRRMPRLRVMSTLYGYGVELDLKVTIREVSLGGFSVESPIPFPIGAEQTFLVTTADGRETMVRCKCRHSHTTDSQGATVCVAGFEFLPQPAENLRIIAETIERLQAKAQQDPSLTVPE